MLVRWHDHECNNQKDDKATPDSDHPPLWARDAFRGNHQTSTHGIFLKGRIGFIVRASAPGEPAGVLRGANFWRRVQHFWRKSFYGY